MLNEKDVYLGGGKGLESGRRLERVIGLKGLGKERGIGYIAEVRLNISDSSNTSVSISALSVL